LIRDFVILGGGSAYTPGLLQALIHHRASLGLARVRLYDTHAEHLDLVGRLGKAMARSAGAGFTVETVSSLGAALVGAEVVLNSTRPGGLAARRLDETIPLALGIPGQETVGPGGFFFALRSVPEAMRLADTLEAEAPDALLLNYTNPSNIVTQALVDRGGVRVLGLCDQSEEDLHDLAQALHRPLEPRAFRCNGLNHATWYSDVDLGGNPLADLPAALPAPEGLDGEHRLRFELSLELARTTPGYWPNSYLPYYLAPERFVRLSREQGPRTDVILRSLPDYYAHFREEADQEIPRLRFHRGSSGFGDLAVTVLRALGAKEPATLVLNVENRGITDQFSATTVVESRSGLSAAGLERREAPALPPGQADLLLRLEAYQRLAAEAARSGDEPLILKALEANPLVGTRSQAAALWDLARERYGPLLPVLA
jgi:6-phospho-beta-glucosidase